MTNPPDTPQGKPSRRNQITTYATIEGIQTSLVRLEEKMDNTADILDDVANVHRDHSTRIRMLETNHAVLTANQAAYITMQSGKGDIWKWVWAALFTVGTFGVAVLNYLK